MYYSKQQLTKLYRKYFYGNNNTDDYDFIEDVSEKNGLLGNIVKEQDKYDLPPSAHSSTTLNPISFQIIEKIIYGKKWIFLEW